MELPPFLRYQDVVRYVPFANHHPPPPSPPNFSEDRNFYTHQGHHHLRPPPPLPIAPPPQSYRPLAPAPTPPLPFKPHQSQFTFLNHRPIEDDHRRPRHLLDFPRRRSSPPRIFDRSLFDDNCPRLRIPELDNPLPDSRPDYWADRPRVQPENQVPLGFDREPHDHHCPFNNQVPLSPYQTTENYWHDLEGSFRLTDDFIDGFKPNDTEDPLRGRTDSHGCDHDNNYHHSRVRYASNSSGTSRSFVFNDSKSVSNPNALREFGSNLGNYESCHASVSDSHRFSNNINENWRWGHVRRPSRELLDPPVETENKEFGNVKGDGVQAVSSRRVPHIYDSGKFNYSGSREGKQEFLHTPRKKVQKKSALLRVQFGKHHNRNRNDEHHFPSARSDDSDHTSTFRSRGPPVYSNNRVKGNRERSPVDLDISFKSHALVAKAILSSSSHEVESCRNLKSRNRKIRKLTIPESDLLNSPLTKLNEGPAESDSSAYALDSLDYPTISHKDSKQSRDNIIDSGNEAVCGVGSLASSNSSIDSPVITTLKELVSDEGGNTVGSDGTSSLRFGKKRKVISTLSHVSSSQAMKKNVEPVKVDRSINNPPAASHPDEDDTRPKGETASDGMVLVHNVDLQPCPNEVTALLEHKKVDESTWAIVAEKDGTNIDSGGSYVPNTKRERNSSTPLLDSSSPLKTKVDEGSVITGRSVNADSISNSDKDPVELQNGSTFSEIVQVGDVRQQYCQNEPPVLLQNGLVKGSPEAKLSVGGNVNTDLSCPGEIKICEGPANLYSSFHDEHNALSSNNGIFKRQLKNTVPYIEAMDAGSEYNQATVLLESAAVEGSTRAIPTVGGNAIVSSSSGEETKIHEGVLCANGSNHSATTASVSDNVLTNSEWKIPVSEIGSSGDSSEESCPHGAIVLLENDPMEGPPKARMSVGGNFHGFGKGFTPKKRKDRDTQLGLSSPSTSGMPVNAVSIARPIDRTLSCPVKDLDFAEEEVVVSVAGKFDAGSQPCTDKDSIARGSSLTEGSFDNDLSVKGSCSVDQNRTSPKYIKKRKVLAPVSPSPIRSETQEGPVSAGTPTFRVELLSNTDGGLTQSEDIVAVSNIATVCSARVPPCSDGNHLSLTNLHDEMVESVPDKLSNMCSPENLSIVTGLPLLNNKISPGQISNGKGRGFQGTR